MAVDILDVHTVTARLDTLFGRHSGNAQPCFVNATAFVDELTDVCRTAPVPGLQAAASGSGALIQVHARLVLELSPFLSADAVSLLSDAAVYAGLRFLARYCSLVWWLECRLKLCDSASDAVLAAISSDLMVELIPRDNRSCPLHDEAVHRLDTSITAQVGAAATLSCGLKEWMHVSKAARTRRRSRLGSSSRSRSRSRSRLQSRSQSR